MREQFTVGYRAHPDGIYFPISGDDTMTWDTYRGAQDYLDEFYSGPAYLVMSRHVTDWVVA